MPKPSTSPYGTWESPISAELITQGALRLGEIHVDRDVLTWVEMRPDEGGRHVVMRRRADGSIEQLTPPEFNARTRVHEYGGGAVAAHDGTVWFANFTDQRVYRQDGSADPSPVTPEGAPWVADAVVDAARGRLIGVGEDHVGSGEPVNCLLGLDMDRALRPQRLAGGHDFYAAPRLSPDGTVLAWLTWDHPDMPWDATQLWTAPLDDSGDLGTPRLVAGAGDESVVEPTWSPDGELYFVSDRNGWWNLYRERAKHVEQVLNLDAEFAQPAWMFGNAWFAFLSQEEVACVYAQGGSETLAVLDLRDGGLKPIETPYTSFGAAIAPMGTRIACVAASPTKSPRLVLVDPSSGDAEVVRASTPTRVDPAYVSVPEAIEFPTAQGLTAHAFFYQPRNTDFHAPVGERPPLIVMIHGGPTSASSDTLRLTTQFWTSRGFAVVDVNYGGSSGYGRAYRERLNYQWGVVDVDDCEHAARFLVSRGDVDPKRMAITGGSAGGYTTLAALAFRDVFAAGASHYGVSDPAALTRDTHKFESRYLDRLIGPYPERRDVYTARSPIHAADRIACPLILFQGSEDAIVPRDQSRRMAEVLRTRGVPVAYLEFAGEQHGFRRAESIERALEAELSFYAQVFGFEPAGDVEAVPIENL